MVKLLDIQIDNLTMQEALARLEEFVSSKKPHLIVTPNPEMIVDAQTKPAFKALINSADLRLPDGISMVVVSKILGIPLKERVSGIDFMLKACALSAQKGYRVFLLGSQPGIARKAAEMLVHDYPGLNIAGSHHGYFKPEDDMAIVARIKNAKPDILFAGLGHGRQERWLAEYLLELNVPACAGIGGSLDVISGEKKRAPRWAQSLYIEWLYRLICEPWRCRRQAALIKFLWLVFGPGFFYNRNKTQKGPEG